LESHELSNFLEDEKELYDLYQQAQEESKIWRKDYHEYERLADNGLLEDLDPDLPETNDGSLAASLYKLPKRIINSDKKGRATALDADDKWITELANLQWENNIIPNANSQAPFHRKWKDAVRKSAIYGSVPLVTLFVERGEYIGADFIVAQPQDVKLEPGKVSDYDSDVMFWDVYYTRQQVKSMIERAKTENKEAKENGDEESYNKWDVKALEDILNAKQEEESREADEDFDHDEDSVRQKGVKFCIILQRGVNAPFYMYHPSTKKKVREWSNPDPTGDLPIHFLYCYQDFKNPYGVGIVKLAGGTQNVLDTMRQYDVLATQLGFRPPVSIGGDLSDTDLDSIIYAQDAQWMVGNAQVKREEISNQIYGQLPDRMQMYKQSLNQMLPMGDTSVSAGAGDPLASKTPAGVKQAAAMLSIDDEDFKDNVDMTYEAVAKSMINTHFANMQGSDLMRLNDDEREILMKAGLEFPTDPMTGEPMTNELEVIWDEARATFDFEMEAESDRTTDEAERLEGLLKIIELRGLDPTLEQSLQMSGKQLNLGELFSEIINLTTKNDKIITDISPEDMEMQQAQMQEQQMMEQQAMQPEMPQEMPMEQGMEIDPEDQVELNNIQAISEQYGVSENIASAMREAEMQGASEEQIMGLAKQLSELEAQSNG